ncbi:MAG: flagellar biosynthetic protein FliR [Flavonifractor plautii]
MVDWAQLYLFELIFMRMSGFLLFNPLLGRSNLPAMVKTGMALVLSILVFGTAGTGVPQPDTLVELAFRLLLELGIGLVLGFVMRVVFSVVQIGGEVIDTQMGMTMAQIYDASSQANLSVTASLLNILLILDFFAENGHYTLMRLLTTSGELVPYGAAALGDGVYAYVIELFLACMLLAVKLAMPILAAELLGEVGMGVLMKAIPQINAFVINIELKVIIGLLLFFLLLTPINEFLLELESGMLGAGADTAPDRGSVRRLWQTVQKPKKQPLKAERRAKKGNVFFSNDAVSVAVLLASFCTQADCHANGGADLPLFAVRYGACGRAAHTGLQDNLSGLVLEMLKTFLFAAGPLLATTAVVAVAATFFQTKLLVSGGAEAKVQPD